MDFLGGVEVILLLDLRVLLVLLFWVFVSNGGGIGNESRVAILG